MTPTLPVHAPHTGPPPQANGAGGERLSGSHVVFPPYLGQASGAGSGEAKHARRRRIILPRAHRRLNEDSALGTFLGYSRPSQSPFFLQHDPSSGVF